MKRINESGGSKYSININKEKPRKEDPILPVVCYCLVVIIYVT
jgi:hypothetical protein